MGENERRGDSLAHSTTELAPRDGTSGDRARAQPPDWRPAFDPDTVLADRYRIVRFLARGGMGEVYEAEDLVLRMRVALKSIAPELVTDAGMIEHLKQEVLLARKVTHANVCRLYDLGFDTSATGTSAFLTMDLLRGDTLAAHIARKGRLSAREALPIARQFGEALEAAHEAGVIHRDFKTRNVMLVPDVGKTGFRAVVMDFGIALAAEDEERRALDDGRLVGTPAYMAPEQMKGEEITRATDVYALGVVLFEMVTGTLPFEGTHMTDLISSRLTKPPPSPRARVRSLDRAWDSVIVKCLALEPANRFASVRQVIEALDTRRASLVRRRVAVGVGVALVASLATWNRWRTPAADVTNADAHRRPTLAISFADGTPRDDTRWIGTALADMLSSELDADEAIRVVAANRVTVAKRELALDDATIGEPASLARLREALGADYVVLGRYAAGADGSVRVDLALDDARTGATATTASSRGASAKLFDLAAPLAAAIRKKLGARDPSEAQFVAARAAAAENADAERAYAEGRERLASSDYVGALASFERATKADPSFALGHDGLAAAARALGYDGRALEESRRAYELSRSLSREQQLGVEERYRESAKEWDRAAAIGRALVEFYPDDVGYGLRYAHSLMASGKQTEALGEIDRLHALPAPDGEDARIDIAEALAAGKMGNATRKLAASRRAVEKATRTGELTVLADGHVYAGGALTALHRPDEAIVDIEAARAIYVRLHDRKFEADAVRSLALLAYNRGDAIGAEKLTQQALAITRELGDRYEIASDVLDLAANAWLLGDDTKARASADEARGLWEAISDGEGIGFSRQLLGKIAEDQGDLAGAKALMEQARADLRAVDQQSGTAETSIDLAALAETTGDAKGAEGELGDAERIAKEVVDDELLADATMVRARIAIDQGDEVAGKRLAEATLSTAGAAHAPCVEDLAKLLLARIALDDDRASEAETLARAVVDDAHAGGRRSDEADALAALSAALVAEKKLDEASTALDRATALLPARVEAQLSLALSRAAMLAATPAGRAQATSLLDQTQKRAQALGFVAIATSARHALARLGR